MYTSKNICIGGNYIMDKDSIDVIIQEKVLEEYSNDKLKELQKEIDSLKFKIFRMKTYLITAIMIAVGAIIFVITTDYTLRHEVIELRKDHHTYTCPYCNQELEIELKMKGY